MGLCDKCRCEMESSERVEMIDKAVQVEKDVGDVGVQVEVDAAEKSVQLDEDLSEISVQVEEEELVEYRSSWTQTAEVVPLAQVRPINQMVSNIFSLFMMMIIIMA